MFQVVLELEYKGVIYRLSRIDRNGLLFQRLAVAKAGLAWLPCIR